MAPFRADHVGSLLRPALVREARQRRAAGTLDDAGLAAAEDEAIRHAVARQEALGLRCVTDGEIRRMTWALDFLQCLAGTTAVPRPVPLAAKGGLTEADPQANKILKITGKLRFVGSALVDHFKFLSANAHVTAKMTIPCPTMLLSASRDWRDNVDQSIYPRVEDLYQDLGVAYRDAVRAFYAAGCRYLQFDDVNLAYLCDETVRARMAARGDDPDATLRLWVQTLNTAIADRPSDLVVTTHICRGNFRSSWFAQGGYEKIADTLFNQTDYDGYFLEYDSERAGGFEPLRYLPKGRKRVVLGLVTTKSGQLEDSALIKQGVEAASKFADLGQLCLSPQCGFASTAEGNLLTEEEQWAKLQRIVATAREIWQDA